ncbi:MAG: hypothetical protein LCH54_15560 [Bacteroidetes bacterium]|nr:hypothetical protein [Bacteroidota bacterium]
MGLLTGIRDEMIVFLNTQKVALGASLIGRYSGEISRINQLTINTPAVLVYIPEGAGKASDFTGRNVNHNPSIGIYFIVKNLKGEGLHVDIVTDMIDLLISELPGKTIDINGRKIYIGLDYSYAIDPDGFGSAGVAVGSMILQLSDVMN